MKRVSGVVTPRSRAAIASHAIAQEVAIKGRVSVLIGTTPGGGTDGAGHGPTCGLGR
ncbi:MAG: hypothetical protein RL477_1365 [Pseudomonadota bacterium]|jgi:hypothetical protein